MTRHAPLRSALSAASPIAPPDAVRPAQEEKPQQPATPAPAGRADAPAQPAPAPVTPQPAPAQVSEPAAQERPATARSTSRTTKPARSSQPKSGPKTGPKTGGAVSRKWDEYEAKTARLRPDQRLQLTTIARQLTLAKKGAGEKITDNTLIRVAVDILIAESPRLLEDNQDGPLTTEQEIRVKLGLTS